MSEIKKIEVKEEGRKDKDKSDMAYVTDETSTKIVNEIVEKEMRRIKFNWKVRKENYVENMLEQNLAAPKLSANRTEGNQSSMQDGQQSDLVFDTTMNSYKNLLQERRKSRAEAYHHFRVSKKIRKAKFKYRFQYVSNKLLETADMLESIHDLVDEAEKRLISQGFSQNRIENLRQCFGADKTAEIISNMRESMQEGNQ